MDKQPQVLELMNQTKNLTAKAKEAVLHAQGEAGLRFQQPAIGTEHLLLGLLRVQDAVALRILDRLNIAPEQVRQTLENQAPHGEHRVGAAEVMNANLTPQAQRALAFARDEAQQFGCAHAVSTPYLLLGLLREEEGLAAQVLAQLGADASRVRDIIAENPHE